MSTEKNVTRPSTGDCVITILTVTITDPFSPYPDHDLFGYLVNTTGPVPLVLDLRIAYDRVGSSTDPNLNLSCSA